jgi:hypothetical protein
MRFLGKATLAVTTCVAMLFAGAGIASAGVDEDAHIIGSLVFFKSDGDFFTVCDTLDDGWNVYAKYEYIRIGGSIQTGEHYVTTGKSTCANFDHNFGEGRPVRFTACVQNWFVDYCQEPWSTGVA